MDNPANQLPYYKSDTNIQANSIYFCLPAGHIAMEINNQVAVKNNNRGDEGCKQFTSNYTFTTEALKPEFVAA